MKAGMQSNLTIICSKMNQKLRFTASFTTILLLGVVAFTCQTRHLGGLQSRSDSHAAAVSSSAPPLDQSTSQELSASAMEKQCVAAATAATVDPVAEFIDLVNEKLVTLIKPEQWAKTLWDKAQWERIAAVVKLTDEESVNLQKRLEQFDLAKVLLSLNSNLTPAARASELVKAKQQMGDWFTTQLGKKRADEIILSNQLSERDTNEQEASRAVSRMSDTLNLSEDQKVQLQAGLVERELNPLILPMATMQIVGTLQTEPPVPDISEDIEKTLTPIQWQMYQKLSATNRQKEEELKDMGEMMSGLLPALAEEIFKN